MFIGDEDNEWVVVVVVVVDGGGSWFSLERLWLIGNGDVDNLLNESKVSGKFGGVAGVFVGVIR